MLVDSSAWIDHQRSGDPVIERLDAERRIWSHATVLGEIRLGCGAPSRRLAARVVACPMLPSVDPDRVLQTIAESNLACTGLGWADAEILAACAAAEQAIMIYTRDRDLQAAAMAMGVAFRN